MASCASVSISTETRTVETSTQQDVFQSFGGPPSKGLYLSVGTDFYITMSTSMIRFVASLAPAKQLLGQSHFEAAQIDSWLSFLWHSIELPLFVLEDAPKWSDNESTCQMKLESVLLQLKESLEIIEAHLLKRDQQHPHFVGSITSIADISFAVTLKYYGDLLLPTLRKDSYLIHWLTRTERESRLDMLR